MAIISVAVSGPAMEDPVARQVPRRSTQPGHDLDALLPLLSLLTTQTPSRFSLSGTEAWPPPVQGRRRPMDPSLPGASSPASAPLRPDPSSPPPFLRLRRAAVPPRLCFLSSSSERVNRRVLPVLTEPRPPPFASLARPSASSSPVDPSSSRPTPPSTVLGPM